MTTPLRRAAALATITAAALLAGCASPPKPYDYTTFKQSKPASLLVLPPVNDSPDVKATYSVLAQVTLPLAEAGYYVLPVTLVDETFRQNGMTTPNDIHAVDPRRLHEVFGADAAVYIKVKRYGSTYAVVASDTTVAVEAKIVDLHNGALLWEGSASASSSENNSSSQGGLVGLLVKALVEQILSSATDASHNIAGVANARLFSPQRVNGILYGPRSPNYGKPAAKP
ncbi:DUF799 domain-containing protein [Ideonella sp.]|uniref:DUF799 domain-containing protein n=1 Tax=Ideonella sp. TaxID=1929293 RepID=UPI0035B4CE06